MGTGAAIPGTGDWEAGPPPISSRRSSQRLGLTLGMTEGMTEASDDKRP